MKTQHIKIGECGQRSVWREIYSNKEKIKKVLINYISLYLKKDFFKKEKVDQPTTIRRRG